MTAAARMSDEEREAVRATIEELAFRDSSYSYDEENGRARWGRDRKRPFLSDEIKSALGRAEAWADHFLSLGWRPPARVAGGREAQAATLLERYKGVALISSLERELMPIVRDLLGLLDAERRKVAIAEAHMQQMVEVAQKQDAELDAERAKVAKLRAVAEFAHQTLGSNRVFVTTRERTKHPEGTDLYDEAIGQLTDILSEIAR